MKYQDFFDLADRKLAKSQDYVEFKRIVDDLLTQRFNYNFYIEKIGKIQNLSPTEKAKITQAAQSSILSGKIEATSIAVIIQTLIDNAHKYSKKSGKVEIHISDQPDHIFFSVESYGPRILDSERELIFQPFKRAKDAIKSQEEGAGHGLYISQLIAKRIGTIIEVEQEAQLRMV